MEVQLTTRLQLIFFNSTGGTNTLAPKYFKEEFIENPLQLQEWMRKLSALNLFHDIEKGMDLYTETKGARLIETKTTQLF